LPDDTGVVTVPGILIMLFFTSNANASSLLNVNDIVFVSLRRFDIVRPLLSITSITIAVLPAAMMNVK